ncbi:MAG: DUF2975 domain-containing protein [Flavobacterium sp.]
MKDTDSLKGLTNSIWHFTIIVYPLVLISPFIAPYLFTVKQPNEEYLLWVKTSFISFDITNFWSKVLLFVCVTSLALLLFAFKNFRQLIINFNDDIIFEKSTEILLNKIAKYLNYFILVIAAIFMILRISANPFEDDFLSLVIIFLFSQFTFVLAKLFKRARKLKEENELTI